MTGTEKATVIVEVIDRLKEGIDKKIEEYNELVDSTEGLQKSSALSVVIGLTNAEIVALDLKHKMLNEIKEEVENRINEILKEVASES